MLAGHSQLHNNALKKQVAELEQQLQDIHSEGSMAKDTLKVKDKKVGRPLW